ncbi:MAG: carbamoyltransferase HypF, partial [Desulfobacteraceae bacterium]|nr:carbamoyltransferase HypF [Desulfobacteraceae bacterium]
MAKDVEDKPSRTVPSADGGRRVFVKVRGIVQGVGFRPFIFQLARRHGLGGWVRNQSDGVEIEAAGAADPVRAFIDDITAKAPPLSRIVSIEVAELAFEPCDAFEILRSLTLDSRATLISPDVCTCEDCLREMFDPRDRRFRYPFTNCTNCGPRYTIIKDIPYDRDKTTMARFRMCPECLREYEDPMDRRFHAQPNACPECGPQVWLEDGSGARIASRDDALGLAVKLLGEGSILAVKGLGGFHLAAKATDEDSVSALRRRKVREDKPFAVMFADIAEIGKYCLLDGAEEELLRSPARPIVLLSRREDPSGPAMAPSVAPKNRYLGAFLPYTPLHFLLFHDAPYRALVMTSGNMSDEPIVMENGEARARLKTIADFFLFHDRDIHMRCDDSVTRVLAGAPRPMRRARGFVPVPVFLREPVPPVLGAGAELKSAICLTRGNEAFLSQHIGDLENLETLLSFEHAIAHLERILEIRPELIAHDLHPDYLSTQWALRQENVQLLAVQHHHAHIAAVAAERGIDGPVLGLALDGTGLGADGTIWGGEILMVDGADFERLGHFRQVRLPGGSAAIKEPWRTGLSYLWSIAGEDLERRYGDILSGWPGGDRRLVAKMLERGVNSPVTSSCGRLFDAVSALCGIRNAINYEGQAAIELEQAIEPDPGMYAGALAGENGKIVVDTFPMIDSIVEDVRRKTPAGKIAARFHNGIVRLLAEALASASGSSGINRVL